MATVRGQCRSEPATQLEKLVWVSWAEEWGILQHRETTFVTAPAASMAETNRRGAPRAGKGQGQQVHRPSQAQTTPHPCPTLGWYLPWALGRAERPRRTREHQCMYYRDYFTEEKTEIQKSKVPCPKSPAWPAKPSSGKAVPLPPSPQQVSPLQTDLSGKGKQDLASNEAGGAFFPLPLPTAQRGHRPTLHPPEGSLSQLLPGINSAENTHSGGLPKGSR